MGNITGVVDNGGLSSADYAAIIIGGLAIVFSAIAIIVTYYSYRVSVDAYGIQSFQRYFDINEFMTKEWETLTPLTPLGKSQNEKEAKIRLFLYHRLNRFKLEKDKKDKELHKRFCHAMCGNNIQDFKNILKSKGAPDETMNLAAEILRRIRKEDPSFPDKFWNEFFGPNYFNC